MSGRVTTFAELFDGGVNRVVIPRIQRDYAQGRDDNDATRIRDAFLDVLHGALVDGKSVGLDFVYGDVDDEGTLTPLDGQQRLTTLFLLHWYLAARTEQLDPVPAWARFAYDTRPAARLFCERLVERARPFPLPEGVELSMWIRDEPWFMSKWSRDPTIRSMLVVLDALHGRFAGSDADAAWTTLMDRQTRAIYFHVLELSDMGLTEEIYVKMNSRGKPLTAFEHFKALFQQRVEEVYPELHARLALRMDGAWADIFWTGEGVVDRRLLRYFDFVTETMAWAEGVGGKRSRMARAEALFGPANPDARDNLDRLCAAFDVWVDQDISGWFDSLFSVQGHVPGKLRLFGRNDGVNLFDSCSESYVTEGQGKRTFTLQGALLLVALVVHRIEGTGDFRCRLRVLRNLTEASQFQVRAEAMPQLVQATVSLMRDGLDADLSGFNPGQIDEERRKAELLAEQPEFRALFEQLEDHPLLRGTLGVLDMDTEHVPRRAAVFESIFANNSYLPALTGALLACGDYSQWAPHRRFYYLGSRNAEAWRDLFTGTEQGGRTRTREVLTHLLDRVDPTGDVAGTLEGIRQEFLGSREGHFDWRTYLVKYPAMREGATGIYAVQPRVMGYDLCMLNRRQMNSYYRDPYLHAMRLLAGVGDEVEDSWFMGYESAERWMVLPRSGVALRCVPEGIALRPPTVAARVDAFGEVCERLGISDDLLSVPQQEGVDSEDRVELGAALLRGLVDAGC